MKNLLLSAAIGDIAGPMAYAFYKEIPEELVAQAKEMLPGWMLRLNEKFDSTI